MDKKATTSVPIHDLIANRWSPRAFSDEMVSAETQAALFEAARWAASANNMQPWRYIIANKDNAAAHQQAIECLMPGNQTWAANAQIVGFVIAKTVVDATETKPARPNPTAAYECGLAIGQLTIEAASRDLYLHQMGGINRDKIVATYNIPDGYTVVAGLAIGYMGNADALPDPLRQREQAPRTRKPLSEIVFSGDWDESYF